MTEAQPKFIWDNPITRASVESRKRFVIHQGGTYSMKTYGNIMALILLTYHADKHVESAVSAATYPVLKQGAMRDFENIMRDLGMWDKRYWNATERKYKMGEHGSFIEFIAVDQVGKAKTAKRDYMLINEADNIPWQIARTLMQRVKIKVIIEFNPTEEFWAHEEILPQSDRVDFFRSNFTHTLELERVHGIEIIPREIVRDLIAAKSSDPEYFKIYGLGVTGSKEGRIIKRINVVTEMPPLDACKWQAFGIDYGYTNDPTVVLEVRFSQGELWVDQVEHSVGVGTEKIGGYLERGGAIRRRTPIYPDSAENWGNAELQANGWRIMDVDKRAGSVDYGIELINRYTVNITMQSKQVLKDFRNHKFKIDPKTGEYTNVPERKFKHSVDAVRYVAISLLHLPKRRGGYAGR